MEEELVNDFEEACAKNDYTRAAEILRFARLEFDSLIQLLSTVDGELADECHSLLGLLFKTVDFTSLLSTYGPYLSAALQSEKPAMLRMGIDFCEKALVPQYQKGLPQEALHKFVDLMSHPDTAIYERVANILIASNVLFEVEWITEHLKEIGKKDGVCKTRVMRLVASRLEKEKWMMVVEPLSNIDDELVTMNAMQTIIDECQNEQDLLTLDGLNIIDRIFNLAMGFEEDLDSVIRNQAINAISTFFSIKSELVETFEERYRFAPFLKKCLDQDDNEKAYFVAMHCFTNEFVPDAWIEEVTCRGTFLEPIFHGPRDLSDSAISACAQMFVKNPHLENRQKSLYAIFPQITLCHPIDAIIDLAKTPEESTKTLIFALLDAISQHSWVVSDAISNSHLISFLVDRSRDQSLVAAEGRFKIINSILGSSVELKSPLREQLEQYIKQGVRYLPPMMHVASRREQ